MNRSPALFIVGHGSRSAAGVAEFRALTGLVHAHAPHLALGSGFIELAEPHLDDGLDALVAGGPGHVVAAPLVLLGARHLKDDGPAFLARARDRHPGVRFSYAAHLGLHPLVLELAEERIRSAGGDHGIAGNGDRSGTAVLLVGRGSTDPDANSDLAKAARLLAEGRGLDQVEPAFVSLASPSVPEGLERCRRLGASRVVVMPYFLFTGVLVERIAAQAAAWAGEHPEVDVRTGPHLGADPHVARVVVERFDQAVAGTSVTPCDRCVYRVALPGHESEVGRPLVPGPHHHAHQSHAHHNHPFPA
ncbi:MAG: sirohydrochlorin chelatase [Actinobacteria bacterium]|nr:sirohydrochlorin chelatase [Actinomycetota bacterium]